MKVRKNALSRVIALLMAVALVVGLLPVNTMGTVNAAGNEPEKVTVNGKNVYLYGVDDAKEEVADSENYVISYTGDLATKLAVYNSDAEKMNEAKVELAKAEIVEGEEPAEDPKEILIDKDWLASQKNWIAICVNDVAMEKVSGYTLKANENLVYNEKEQELVTLEKADGAEGTVTYYLDGKEVKGTPKAKEAGEYEVAVKVEKDGYITFEQKVTATILDVVSGYELKARKNLVYNGKELLLTTLEAAEGADGKVTYYLDGKEVDGRPTAVNAGTYKVAVKVEKAGFAPYEQVVEVIIAQAEYDEGSIKFPAEVKLDYTDKEEQEIFTEKEIEEYVPSDSKVQFSKKGENNWSTAIPKEQPEESKTVEYDIMITSNDENYIAKRTVKVIFEAKAVAEGDYIMPEADYVEENENTKINWYKSSVEIKPKEENWYIRNIEKGQMIFKSWEKSLIEKNDGIYENYEIQMRYGEFPSRLSKPAKIETFAIDTTAPKAKKFSYKIKNDNTVAEALNLLSFGYFFNKTMVIEVEVEDEGVGPEKVDFILYKDNAEGQEELELRTVEVKENVAILEYDGEEVEEEKYFSGTVAYVLKDKLGNKSDETFISVNNKKISFMIENNVPDIENIKINDEDLVDGAVYNTDAKITFDVTDNDLEKESGLNSVSFLVNNDDKTSEAIETELPSNATEILGTYTIAGKNEDTEVEGAYKVIINAVDNSTNEAEEKEFTIYQDTTSPVITSFKFETEDNESAIIVNNSDYKYFFQAETKAIIAATDITYYGETTGVAGVESITYKLVGKVYNSEKEKYEKVSAEPITKDVNEAGMIEAQIPAGFKGYIYAYATDKVGNNPNSDNVNIPKEYSAIFDEVNVDGYVHPMGEINENQEMHKSTSSITITAKEASGVQANKNSYNLTNNNLDRYPDYDTAAFVPLYDKATSFAVNVVDGFSGIKTVKWTLLDKNSKVLKSNEFAFDAEKNEGWTVNSKDENLVTSVSTNVKVDNELNDMTLVVELTDRSNNTSYDYYMFGVDSIDPKVSVTYKERPSGDKTFFDESRTATIKVEERNFDEEKFIVKATRDEKDYPITLKWVKDKKTSGDKTTYTAKVTYAKEGDYTFKVVSCTDRATNKITDKDVKYTGAAPKKFTIDKTNPTVSVSYNNNSAQNGKYFKANRTSTIVVKEHNFDTERVDITMTARKNGSAIGVPGVSWSHNGDTHTATIAYNKDGDYTFDIAMTDKAGRKNDGVNYGGSVAEKEFTVDTTITDPTIGGVENGNAYPDEVIPIIKFDDINFENVEVKLVRTTKGNKNVDVTEEFIKGLSKNGQGGSGTFDTFKKIAENDGIYTLTVNMTDKAGNRSEKTVTFTVNRYGSVYVFDDYLTSLQGSYVQKVDGDIVLTEYNANRLKKDSLKIEITKDGQPVANPSYEVSPVINKEVNVGSSGWYQYEYTIAASNFTEDGVYKITVASEDEAGNKPETENYEDCEMLFSVDSTPAEITNIAGLEEAIVNADSLEFSMEVFDAIGLKSVTVYVNGEVVEVFDNMDDLINFMGSYKLSAGANQEIKIVVEDLAGNITDTSSEDFAAEYEFNDTVTVSTNFFVRWFANKPLFFGSIAGFVAVVGGAIWFAAGKKRKKEDEEAK